MNELIIKTICSLGQEPLSSGYGRRLMFHMGQEVVSCHTILDGHFSYLFVVKIVMCVWEGENNEKEAGVGPFL